MIRGYIFDNQLDSNEIESMINRKQLNYNDGIFRGMELSNTSNTITVGEGVVMIAGRPVGIIGSESITVESESYYCKLVMEIDLTKEATATNFEQAYLKIIKSASEYPSLTQQDMDNGGTLYQYELARFRTSANGITDFTDMRTYLDFDSIYSAIKAEYRKILAQLQQELASVEDGSAYVLKNNFQEYRILSNETSESEVTCNFVRRDNVMFLYVEVIVQPNAVISKNITVNMPEWAKTSLSEYILAKSNYVVDYDYVNCAVKSYSSVRLYKNNNEYSLNVYATNKDNQYDSIQNFILVYPIVN